MTSAKLSPLKNVKILDFTRVLAGPFCTMLLGDLGAEVWKIERPKIGDDTRNWKPPSIGGESCYFVCVNRNKKSLAIDIKHPKATPVIQKLMSKSDVLIENFKPGVMERLGFDYDTVNKRNSRIIYCSITGYGKSGPLSTQGGYDVIAEAIGGLMHITGSQNGQPSKAGVAVVDMLAGLYAHGAIMAALLQRNVTGYGQRIDCNLLSTQCKNVYFVYIATLVNIGSNYLNAGIEGRRWGTGHESIVPYQGYRTKDDRWLIVGAGNDKQFVDFCNYIDLPHLAQDPKFSNNSDRVKNRDILNTIIQNRFSERSLKEWIEVLDKSELPHGPVNTIEEAFANPQVLHNQMMQTVHHPITGTMHVTGPAVNYSGSNNTVRSPPPLLGEHTEQVLHESLNLTHQQIASLKAQGVVDF